MEARDLVQTIAEIAIAVAGFAGVVAVFARRGEQQAAPETTLRFEAMLAYSFSTVLASFFPLIPLQYGASELTSWKIAAALYCVLAASVNIGLLRRFARRQTPASPAYFAATILLTWSPLILVALHFLGVGSLSGNYVVALVLVLSQAFLAFIRVVSSLLAEPPAP